MGRVSPVYNIVGSRVPKLPADGTGCTEPLATTRRGRPSFRGIIDESILDSLHHFLYPAAVSPTPSRWEDYVVKILVTVKSVEDPEIKIKIKPDGKFIETEGAKYVVNPFDEIAVEEALRLRDAHKGEVVIACVGKKEATQQIRTALAMGADRGIHVIADGFLDPVVASMALAKVIADEKPDLVLLGKQAIDDDAGQVGAMVAERLGWGQACFASKEVSLESEEEKAKKPAIQIANNVATVIREVDGGFETVALSLPGILTVELRLNVPRYASLPGIMKAKKKEVKELQLAAVVPDAKPRVTILKMEAPTQRKAGIKVEDVPTLVAKLKNEAKVL
jgi:electron transfer flavoprotein beta subunit